MTIEPTIIYDLRSLSSCGRRSVISTPDARVLRLFDICFLHLFKKKNLKNKTQSQAALAPDPLGGIFSTESCPESRRVVSLSLHHYHKPKSRGDNKLNGKRSHESNPELSSNKWAFARWATRVFKNVDDRGTYFNCTAPVRWLYLCVLPKNKTRARATHCLSRRYFWWVDSEVWAHNMP